MKKPTRSRVVMITGLAGFALATAGCPITPNPPGQFDTDVITNPPPQDTGDTGDTGDDSSKDGKSK